jgi:aerobic C4-dicarboxylate transport protein
MQTVAQAQRKPLYKSLYVQVIAGIVLGILVGYVSPSIGVDMKPLGDVFIKMIKMVIGLWRVVN